MKRSAGGIAPFQGCHPLGAAGCCLAFVLLFSLLCSVCYANQPVRSLLPYEDRKNVTLTADNVCLKDIVEEKQTVYYNLDSSECFKDPFFGYKYLEVEARIYQQCDDSHEWSVLVNTEGELVPIEEARASEGKTFVNFIDAEHHRFYGHLDVPLDGNASQPWVAGFYSSCGPVLYTLKAWCSANKGCDINCSDPDSGPCVSVDNCRCTKSDDDEKCEIEVEDLPDEEDWVSRHGLAQTHNSGSLRYGTWRYFRFKASNNATRILVEMQRAYGDLILFVNHEDSDDDDADEAEVSADSLPKEQDALKYADLPSFQNRLSHHHVFVNGSGNFYIGVYNADQCVEEDATFNLTITIATPDDPLSLCPLNCSYPQGQCVSDNTCSCEPGYGGMYCAGSIRQAAARRPYSGQLQPGEWAYINMTVNQLTDNEDILVQFSSSTGHPILLAQKDRFPTLKDFSLKFSNSTLGATPSDTYHISKSSLNSGELLLGVFNIDYSYRGISDFQIVVSGAREGLSIWVIILVALGCSIFLLTLIATVRSLMHRGQAEVPESWGLDFEAVPQDVEMVQMRTKNRITVSTLPLLAYHQGMLPKEDAGCSICLNSYDIAEIVCRLPGCKHIFHLKCLEEWFQTDDSCPLCRVPLAKQAKELSASEALAPQSSPSLSEPSSSSTWMPGLALDQPSPFCSCEVGDIKSAPRVGKDDGLLPAEGESLSSLGSTFSNSEGSDSESPLQRQH
ncbi:uncharacterized protein [Physcomitrium patens]|uniref:RING-type domain-containing protein n=1 Tax=Physcomitrium patens TaxID=3218 RepID=A0A2K1K3H3_PHYPA|nr:uncharacterized protein LOC112286974 [Physcomitrium patens]PNR48317.1 hypothetical protein PHYPA_012793 [Physcomitrium patens]|eukprot:XP_024385263.1 uncharacterized protein LOC112286974 [Physcomitrella patens]